MLFVDTSAFYALADSSDAHHAAAKSFYTTHIETLGPSRVDLVTSDYVFVESFSLLKARLGRKASRTFWEWMRTGIVRLLGVEGIDLDEAWRISEAHPDQDLSLVDVTSFAVIARHGIREAFAFNRHFQWYRFGPDHKQRLTVFPDRP